MNKLQLKVSALIFTSIVFISLLLFHFGATNWGEKIRLLEILRPKADNGYTEPLIGFCLYAPVITLLLAFFVKAPFSRFMWLWLSVQFGATIITWLFLLIIIIGGPFTVVNPNLTALFIMLWATLSLAFQLVLIVAAASGKKWVIRLFSS